MNGRGCCVSRVAVGAIAADSDEACAPDFGVPLRVNCSCATRKQLRGPLLSVKNASPCADLELATNNRLFQLKREFPIDQVASPYDVRPDGQQFLVFMRTQRSTQDAPITVVLNWWA